ncbi:MAG: tetratricopeptide repeat protein [Bacteroidales bacterium]
MIKENNCLLRYIRLKETLITILIIISLASCSPKKEIGNRFNTDIEAEFYYTFLEANRLKILGEYDTALKLFLQCLEIKPTSDGTMHEIARINGALGYYEPAIKYAKMAVKQNPENKFYYYTLADIYLDNKQIEQAIEVYENIQKIEPENHEVAFYLAMLYKQNHKLNDAINTLIKLEEKVGVNESISINKQQIFLFQGNKTKAYDEINKLIKNYPEEAKYYAILADMYTRDNLLLKAEETITILFEKDSLNAQGQITMIDFYRRKVDYDHVFLVVDKVINNELVEFGSKVMVLYSFLNTPKEMSLYGEKIESNLLKFKSIYPDKLEGFTLYTDFLVKKNQYEKAGDQLEDAIRKFSDNEIIWEQLISIYSYLGKFDRMFEKATIATDRFPENPSFYFYKGLSALQIKKEEIAAETLLKGLPLVKDNKELEVNYYIYLGESYQAIKNYPQSEYYFEKALEMKPDEAYVLNNYSYYLSVRDSKLELAEKLSKITINAEPDNSTYLDTYAWILYKLERYQDALFYIKKAYEYGGYQNAVIVDHYGDILLKNQNSEEAIKMWELSKKLGNTSSEITKKIELYKQNQHED